MAIGAKLSSVKNKILSVGSSINSVLKNNNVSKRNLILILVIVSLFIGAAVFVYVNYIKPQLIEMDYKPNYEFDKVVENKLTSRGRDAYKNVDMFLFWADWCPNSNKEGSTGTKLHSVWDKVEDDFKNKRFTVNGFNIRFKKINENDNDFGHYESVVRGKGEIEGFPSIFIVYKKFGKNTTTNMDQEDKIVYEFDAMPSEENIKELINKVLLNE